MKKLTTIFAIVLGMTLTGMAQGGGLFERGAVIEESTYDNYTRDGGLVLPSSHGQTNDADAPVGSGITLLIGLGAAYLVGKKHYEK